MAPKGPAFERKVSKQLSLWWSNLYCDTPREDLIWRTHGSGARATVRAKHGKDTYGQFGDLCATDPIAQPLFDSCLFSLKKGYTQRKGITRTIEPLLLIDSTQEKPLLQEFWEEICNLATTARKWPILIFQRDHMHACIGIQQSMFHSLKDYSGSYDLSHFLILPKLDLVIFPLQNFLTWASAMNFGNRKLTPLVKPVLNRRRIP